MPSSESRSVDVIPVVAIIAALPREIAALVKGLPADAELVRHGIHLYRRKGAVVVAAGMGAARAAMAVQAARSAGNVTTLISAGLAGACIPELDAGGVVEAHRVIDARTGERFAAIARDRSAGMAGDRFATMAEGRSAGMAGDRSAGTAGPDNPEGDPGRRPVADRTLVTTGTIASIQEKARLAATYGAALVDMEAATVARLAAAHGLGFRAIKGISDAYDFELVSLARFADKQGSFRTAAFALHTALHPHQWRPAARLGRDSRRALTALHAALFTIIASGGR